MCAVRVRIISVIVFAAHFVAHAHVVASVVEVEYRTAHLYHQQGGFGAEEALGRTEKEIFANQ